jgi:hypothetical protein
MNIAVTNAYRLDLDEDLGALGPRSFKLLDLQVLIWLTILAALIVPMAHHAI